MKKNTTHKEIKSKRNDKVSEAISKKLKADKENTKEGVDLIGLAKELASRNNNNENE